MSSVPGSRSVPREELERHTRLGREMSGLTVLFHSRVAERLGVSVTDHKCLDIAMRADSPLTAGQIARLSGLSTGAVTGVIDRLEKRGFVRRLPDPNDRRKVLVEASLDESRYAHLFDGAVAIVADVLAEFTAEERAVIERYQEAMVARFQRAVAATPAGSVPGHDPVS